MTKAEGKGRPRALFGRILGKCAQAWAGLDRGKEVTPKNESMLDQWPKIPPRERLYDLPGYRKEAEEVALPREVSRNTPVGCMAIQSLLQVFWQT
ncbi:MAG: hypothetical protein IOD05_09005 [Rhodobacter sp.]|nr:hypothetical protein [Rhodobacter sp.]